MKKAISNIIVRIFLRPEVFPKLLIIKRSDIMPHTNIAPLFTDKTARHTINNNPIYCHALFLSYNNNTGIRESTVYPALLVVSLTSVPVFIIACCIAVIYDQ